jgi:two-component system, sensor histidine kinase
MRYSLDDNRSSSRIEILLVDDREDGLIALEALLQQNKDYELVKARSGRQALDLLPNHDFAAILLDVQMPYMDGFETAALMRKTREAANTPIIFVTAIDKDERYVYRGYEAGAVDYIFKPFDPIILNSKVAVFAQLHQQRKQLLRQSLQLRAQENLRHNAEVQALEIENLQRYRSLGDAIPHIIWRENPF